MEEQQDRTLEPMQPPDIGKLAEALSAFQTHMPQINLDAEVVIQTKSGSSYTFKYATLGNIMKKILPVLGEQGLAIAQIFKDGNLITTLMHKSGQQLTSVIPIDVTTGAMQEIGSRISYLRRYSLSPLLSIVAESDDDGNIADSNREEKKQGKSEKRGKAAKSPEEFSFKVRMAKALKVVGAEAVKEVIGVYGFVDVDQITDPKMQEGILEDLRKVQKKRISEKKKAKTTNFDWLKEMKAEKDRVGEEVYYEALAEYRCKKANELMDGGDQREVLKDLCNCVVKQEPQGDQGSGFPADSEIPF